MGSMELIYREEFDRWLKGDRFVRPVLRRLLRGKRTQLSGMQTVVENFKLGLRRRKVPYSFNRPFFTIGKQKKVISFGLGLNGLNGLSRANPVIAAVGFPYPAELPQLCEQFNIRRFLQHSDWVLEFVRSANIYPNEVFGLWPAGIDTEKWAPRAGSSGKMALNEVLIYDKTPRGNGSFDLQLVKPIKEFLRSNGHAYAEVIYGKYSTEEYQTKLSRAKAMIFLSAHESQGLACQECLSSNVPVLAWDQGLWLDPVRHKFGRPFVPATSVPYFDERCGARFRDAEEFVSQFPAFLENVHSGIYRPREYILENLTIEESTRRMLEIYDSI